MKKVLCRGLFRLLAHEYLFELSLHSCSSSRFSTTYSKKPIPTDSEIVCEMGVIVYEMGVIVCEIPNAANRNLAAICSTEIFSVVQPVDQIHEPLQSMVFQPFSNVMLCV